LKRPARREPAEANAVPRKKSPVYIRRAKPADARRVAQLSGQLGYPATKKQIIARMKRLTPASQHAVFVAQQHEVVIGWVHVTASRLLEVPARAEINALIVDEAVRSGGIGELLLEAAEKWARRAGCRGVSVRSNVIRERAHHFYQKNGYEHYKTQKAFRKKL
jgi:GNAT superfamily N-acetyltransferase